MHKKEAVMQVQADVVLSENDNGPVARASVKYGGVVRVNGYTVWRRQDGEGYFIAPPQNPLAKAGDKYTDMAYGSTEELREEINRAILTEFSDVIKNKTSYSVTVHVYKKPKSNDLATADVIFGDEFVVKGFSIYRDKENDELLVSMPRNDFLIGNEWHKGEYTIEAIRYGLIPDIKKQILAEYSEQLERGNFEKDYIQQRDGEPATYNPAERESAGQSEANAQETELNELLQ
jgi:DNA-binding cell septation regulator SpoVG